MNTATQERLIISNCIADTDQFLLLGNELRPEQFSDPLLGEVWAGLGKLSNENKLNLPRINQLLVSLKIIKDGEDATDWITPRLAAQDSAVQIIKEKHRVRSFISILKEGLSIIEDPEKQAEEAGFELVGKIEQLLEDEEQELSHQDHVTDYLKKFEQRGKDTMPRPKEAFSDLQGLTGGLKEGLLKIIAARPGMGKTTYLLTEVINYCEQGVPVVIFSLEMTRERIFDWIVSGLTQIEVEDIEDGKLTDADYHLITSAIEKIYTWPLEVFDNGGLNVMDIKRKVKLLKRKMGVRKVYLDYVQLLKPVDYKMNREQQVAQISRELKIMAGECEVDVSALSQLSRAVETRGGAKRPQLSDLRESGAIEQDADFVGFLYRPAYYGIMEDEEGRDLTDSVELIVAKNRGRKLGKVEMNSPKPYSRFYNPGDRHFAPTGETYGSIQLTTRPDLDEEPPF